VRVVFPSRRFRFPHGKVWLGALTAMTASVGLFGAGSASAAEVLDAHCGDPTNPVGSSFPSIPRVGQTFTALNTGQLISATVSVNKSGLPPPAQPDAAFSMQIRPLDVSGVPEESAASAIATEAVPAPASAGFAPLTANFLSPASVVAGHQYALVVERTVDSFGMGIENPAVPCAGDMWLTNPVPVWAVNCTPDMPPVCTDLAFSIRVNAVEPPPTPPPAQPTPPRQGKKKKCKKKKKKKGKSVSASAKKKRCKKKKKK
jgi:hypothetical protein